jgi:hypothetical protein
MFMGAGWTRINGAMVTHQGDISATHLALMSGILDGTGHLSILEQMSFSEQFLNQAKFTWLAGKILSLRVTHGLDHPTAVFEITKNAEGPSRLLDSSLLTNYGIVNWRDADFTMASTVGYCGIDNFGTFIAWSDAPLYTIPINGVIEFINDIDRVNDYTGVFVKMPESDPSDIFVDFNNKGDVYGTYLLSFWGNVSGDGNWW